ncbi:hypothetical protein E2C01_084720 [Portunus trituberculatus]|uniref:Uncharacterized protein n=1 Tax=Portunus trituberculatus TaxID=210409 RepID=A0A5B7IW29_PORTR|nr:hypothetical protein [Portunus trituberculatus]
MKKNERNNNSREESLLCSSLASLSTPHLYLCPLSLLVSRPLLLQAYSTFCVREHSRVCDQLLKIHSP